MTVAAVDWTDTPGRKERSGLRWGASLIAVLALHAGVGLALVGLQASAEISEPPPGAVLIDLTPLAPAAAPEPAPPVAEAPPSEPPPPEPVAEPEPPPPEPIPEPVIEPPPPPPVVKEAEVALPEKPPEPPPELPKPEPIKLPVTKPPPKPVKVQHRPRPPAAVPAVTAPAAPSEMAAPVAAPVAPPSPARVRTWQTDLLAHLERHKRYPRSSQARGEQGTAYVRFAIDRQGRVQFCRLERGSGYAALDEETVALVERASPVPAPPEGETRSIIELVVPVRYGLR